MTTEDLKLISPEISMVLIAIAAIAIDLTVKRKGLLQAVTSVGMIIPFGLSIWLWIQVDAEPGRQLTGIFQTVTVDHFALFFKFLVVGVVALVVLASTDHMNKLARLRGEYLSLVILSATGMMLLAGATELITIYVSLELTALPIAALATLLRTNQSSEAGMKFLILSAISSGLLLYGMAIIFGLTGTTYLAEIAEKSSLIVAAGETLGGNAALLLGMVLIVAGFGFKISSVPFQMWVPDVYEGAPTPVAAFISVASKAAGFAVLIRIFYTGFNALELDWAILFATLAAVSMTIGNLVAMGQNNIKRLMGYSTIAHAGYILVGLAAVAARSTDGTTTGPSAVLFYLGAYAFTNLAAFFAIIAISDKLKTDIISEFAGIGRRSPYIGFVLTLSLIALTGIPPTGIFIAKFYMFTAAIQSDLLWLAIVGVVNSVISAYYYMRIVKTLYSQPATDKEGIQSSYAFHIAMGISLLGIVILGVIPGSILKIAEIAVSNFPGLPLH